VYNANIWVNLLYRCGKAIAHFGFLPKNNTDTVDTVKYSLYTPLPNAVAWALLVFGESARIICQNLFERAEAPFISALEQQTS